MTRCIGFLGQVIDKRRRIRIVFCVVVGVNKTGTIGKRRRGKVFVLIVAICDLDTPVQGSRQQSDRRKEAIRIRKRQSAAACLIDDAFNQFGFGCAIDKGLAVAHPVGDIQ